jgi:hypothetical protein
VTTLTSLFDLGRTVATAAAAEQFSPEVLQECIYRHSGGDWGDTCPEDSEANQQALEDGRRLMSVYETAEGTVWVITEWDRSATTVLRPEDY